MSKGMQVNPRGRAAQAVSALLGVRNMIFSGEIKPGDRVSELVMVEKLGVSRTPIRTALNRLEVEGLLTAIPSGGFEVRGFSRADVADSIELRGTTEGLAARLAAERGVDPARMGAMRRLLADIDKILDVKKVDFPAYVKLNEAFHALILEFSGSAVVREQMARITVLPFAGPSAFVEAQAHMAQSLNILAIAQVQHRDIAESIEMREGARAEALMKEHARLARRNLDIVSGSEDLRRHVPGLRLVDNSDTDFSS